MSEAANIIPGSQYFTEARHLLMKSREARETPNYWAINQDIWTEMEIFFKEYLHSYAITNGERTLLYGIPVLVSPEYPGIELI